MQQAVKRASFWPLEEEKVLATDQGGAGAAQAKWR